MHKCLMVFIEKRCALEKLSIALYYFSEMNDLFFLIKDMDEWNILSLKK